MAYYIEHHGIKGQKWGRRRYQNKDGSLTPEGKLRHNQDEPPTRTKKEQRQVRKMQKSYDKLHRKEYANAYNKSADYANKVLIPSINKKYKDVDLSDPDTYDKYFREYEDSFVQVFNKNLDDMYNRIGYRPE